MSPIDAPSLIEVAERNLGVIRRQIDGLDHTASLLQLPFRGNCMNWVLGHLTQSRNQMLGYLGKPTYWAKEQMDRYQRGSEPILEDGDDVIPFEQIIADYNAIHEIIVDRLKSMSPDDLAVAIKPFERMDADSIGEWMRFSLWHETYHVGQLEILRQLTGVNDRIIG